MHIRKAEKRNNLFNQLKSPNKNMLIRDKKAEKNINVYNNKISHLFHLEKRYYKWKVFKS